MSTLKARLIKLERNGRPVNERQLLQIQQEALGELPEAQQDAFASLVDAYLALEPTTRSTAALWDAILARPQAERDALAALHTRCKAREIAVGARG
ncbi:hypothetical protein [Thiorhodococcus minor]|uniref:Uncharacterized protein n=1 Tax=Thiorhodococcus minor TaxID=57489 RepID=A0A6M0K3Z0_9GAMM|nr:hypothetical protein [Thiorhodococcus minor]NEV64129.1 hypothetical protein [Thiorhodococcus minor]